MTFATAYLGGRQKCNLSSIPEAQQECRIIDPFSLFLVVPCRASCLSGDVSVVVENGSADLRVGSGSAVLNVTLIRMEAAPAMEELKELLFTMAERLTQLGGPFGFIFHPLTSF